MYKKSGNLNDISFWKTFYLFFLSVFFCCMYPFVILLSQFCVSLSIFHSCLYLFHSFFMFGLILWSWGGNRIVRRRTDRITINLYYCLWYHRSTAESSTDIDLIHRAHPNKQTARTVFIVVVVVVPAIVLGIQSFMGRSSNLAACEQPYIVNYVTAVNQN